MIFFLRMTEAQGKTGTIMCSLRRQQFPTTLIDEFASARILRIRAGRKHRHTGIWVVVVDNRVFVRSWNDKPEGWFRAFRSDSSGSVLLNGREIAIRARITRSERLRDAVSGAYAAKYNTRASQRWVAGFAEAERALNTIELLPSAAEND